MRPAQSHSRRRFVSGLARASATAWAGQVLASAACAAGDDPAGVDRAEAAGYGTLRVPPTIAGGELVAAVGRQEVWSGTATTVWTVGGTYPSPTVRVRAGATFVARLRDTLAEPLNLHWHGLVTPSDMDGYPSDVVRPGESREYAFEVAQRAGTYWYHPHTDRRTGAQVYAGMAGVFIVEDDEEGALDLPSGPFDVPLVIQDRRSTPDRSFTYAPMPMDVVSGYLGDATLVNGTPNARLGVERTLYRLRLLNGSNARVYRIAFSDGRSFHVIGTDGGLVERPVEATAVDLGPGERLEILVDFSSSLEGTPVLLRSLAFGAAGMGGMGGAGGQGAPLDLLRFEVGGGAGGAARIPSSLASLLRLDPARAVRTRVFALQMGMGPMMGGFAINGRSFDPGRVDARVALGDTEIWEIRNLSQEIHPFHVHATQFQVLDRSTRMGLGPQDLGWKDTVLTWPGETVRLVLRFEHYRGLYVLHCHNLEHEDAGMMSAFEVV